MNILFFYIQKRHIIRLRSFFLLSFEFSFIDGFIYLQPPKITSHCRIASDKHCSKYGVEPQNHITSNSAKYTRHALIKRLIQAYVYITLVYYNNALHLLNKSEIASMKLSALIVVYAQSCSTQLHDFYCFVRTVIVYVVGKHNTKKFAK